MTAFLCPCPLSAQVFAAKNTISHSGQLHARRMVSSLLRRLGPSPERGQVARWLLGPVLVRLTWKLWWSLRLLAQSWAFVRSQHIFQGQSKIEGEPVPERFQAAAIRLQRKSRENSRQLRWKAWPDNKHGNHLQHAPGAVHPNGKGRNWKPCCFHQGKVPRCHWPTGTTSWRAPSWFLRPWRMGLKSWHWLKQGRL